MVADNSPKGFEAHMMMRLRDSEAFKAYQEAFRAATGLPLALVGSDPDHWCMDGETRNLSPFCKQLKELVQAILATREIGGHR